MNKLTSLSGKPFSYNNAGFLRVLDLSGNQITSIGAETFQTTLDLSYLSLRDNKLTEISAAALKPLKKLFRLTLEGNMLSSVQVTAFSSLRVFGLANLGQFKFEHAHATCTTL